MTDLKYLAAPAVAYAVSSILKLGYRLLIRREERSFRHLVWICTYGDGAPSTHAAVLACAVTIIGITQGIGPLFYLAFTVAMVFGYEISEKREKQIRFETYLKKSSDPAMQEIAKEGTLMDMSGHNLFEITVGTVVGIITGIGIMAF